MRKTEYFRGVLHGVLIVALAFAPAYMIGQQTMNGRNYTNTWAVPSGTVFLIVSGVCPAGSTEVTALDGAMPYGTLNAHGDVGGTGGSNNITPTVSSLTAAAQAFTGSSATTSSNSAGTPAGTNGTVTGPAQVISWPAGVPTISGTTINSFSSVINHTHTITETALVQGGTTAATTGTHIMTSVATGGSARAPASGDSFTSTSANPAGGVASITPTINAPGAIAWPAGVPTNATSTIPAETFTGSALAGHTHTLTATGTNGTSAVTGTMNSFDNRPAFVKVIYCQRS